MPESAQDARYEIPGFLARQRGSGNDQSCLSLQGDRGCVLAACLVHPDDHDAATRIVISQQSGDVFRLT